MTTLAIQLMRLVQQLLISPWMQPSFIYEGTAPFIGSYRPHVGDFADFNDESDPNGIWILEVCDNSATDVGELEFVELTFAILILSSAATSLPDAYYADNFMNRFLHNPFYHKTQ